MQGTADMLMLHFRDKGCCIQMENQFPDVSTVRPAPGAASLIRAGQVEILGRGLPGSNRTHSVSGVWEENAARVHQPH